MFCIRRKISNVWRPLWTRFVCPFMGIWGDLPLHWWKALIEIGHGASSHTDLFIFCRTAWSHKSTEKTQKPSKISWRIFQDRMAILNFKSEECLRAKSSTKLLSENGSKGWRRLLFWKRDVGSWDKMRRFLGEVLVIRNFVENWQNNLGRRDFHKAPWSESTVDKLESYSGRFPLSYNTWRVNATYFKLKLINELMK